MKHIKQAKTHESCKGHEAGKAYDAYHMKRRQTDSHETGNACTLSKQSTQSTSSTLST